MKKKTMIVTTEKEEDENNLQPGKKKRNDRSQNKGRLFTKVARTPAKKKRNSRSVRNAKEILEKKKKSGQSGGGKAPTGRQRQKETH